MLALALQYLVRRSGTDYRDYGLIDAKAVKRQRLSSTAETGPVSLSLVDEYESFAQHFKQAVHDHKDGGALDLGMPRRVADSFCQHKHPHYC